MDLIEKSKNLIGDLKVMEDGNDANMEQ